MTRQHRRRLGVGFCVVAALLVTASAAFACTTWLGDMTVAGSVSGSVYAEGSTSEMLYCWDGEPSGTATMNDNTSGTVTVSVSPVTNDCGTHQLSNGTFDIRWTTGTWDPVNPGVNDCMNTTDTGSDLVISGGTGSASNTATFNPGSTGTIQVCASNMTLVQGMQVPVSVV